MTLYNNIGRNKVNSFILLMVFLVVVISVGFAVGQLYDIYWLLPFVVVVSAIQAYASYYYSDKIALAVSRAYPLKKSENKTVHNLVENIAIAAGLPKPKIYMIKDSAPNAFATGRDPEHAALAVTTGLIEKLNRSELEGVLAHEMAHIGNYDIRFMSMVVVLVGIITMISDFAIRMSFYRSGSRRSDNGQVGAIIMIIGVILIVLSPIIATLLQLAVSRKREFLADSTGALITRYPQGLASALKKISDDSEPLEVANKATAHLYISNPIKEKGKKMSFLARMFSTHPPVEDRIAALLKGAGEH